MEKIGPYRVLPARLNDDREPAVLILDTNVVIDMERLYTQGPARVPNSLRDLLLRFPAARSTRYESEVVWGFGATETYWDRGLGPDQVRRRRVAHAAQHVIQWTAEQIETSFANRHPPQNRDKSWPPVIPPLSDIPDPRRFLAVQYGALLRLIELARNRAKWRTRGPVSVLRDFDEWMRYELGARSAYALILAVDLLAGSPERVRHASRLLKLSGDEDGDQLAQKAWNSSWDLFFLSCPDGLTYASLPASAPRLTSLITKDLDPYRIKLRTSARVFIDRGSGPAPYVRGDLDLRPDVPAAELLEAFTADPVTDMHRLDRDPDGVLRQVAAEIYRLESRLGVGLNFSHDGWYLDGPA